MGNISIRTNQEAKKRFEQIHKKLGFKNKGQTFEALVFRESEEATLNIKSLKTIEIKLDYLIEEASEPMGGK